MAKYRITAPDGGTYEVTAPDDASQDQVLAYAQQQFSAQKQPEKPYSATEGMSGGEKFLAGMGKGFVDIGRGVGQMIGAVDRSDIEESRRLDAPLMESGAAKVGNFTGNVMAAAPALAIPGANTVAGAGLIGAGMGLMQPSVSTGETLTNVALGGAGGAAGQKLGQAIGKSLRTPNTTLTAAQQAAKRSGAGLGLELTPAQAAGSKALERMESALESNPVTSGGFDALRERNQRQLNTIAAQAIGENADELSSPVLGRAFDRIGQEFEKVATKRPVMIDPQNTQSRLMQIIDDYEGQYQGGYDVSKNPLFKLIDNFGLKGEATQEQLAKLSSNLGKASRNNVTSQGGDRALGLALSDVKEVVDDALQASLTGPEQAAFQTARDQYRTLMQLTGRTNIVNPSSGNVSGRSLANLLQQKDRTGFLRGGNTSDLYEAARFSQAFPRVVGDSGTATRSMGPADYLAALPANALMKLYLSAPVRGSATAAVPAVNAAQNALARILENAALPAGVAAAQTVPPYIFQQ